jgi:phage-related protein
MSGPPVKIPLFFYRSSASAEPVREWMRELDADDRNVIGQDLMRVQFRRPVGMPLCRPLSAGLWEVRSSLRGDRIARILFFVEDGRIGVLHGSSRRPKRRRSTP